MSRVGEEDYEPLMETQCVCMCAVCVSIMHTHSQMPTRGQTHISDVNGNWDALCGHFNNSSQIPLRPRYDIQFKAYAN